MTDNIIIDIQKYIGFALFRHFDSVIDILFADYAPFAGQFRQLRNQRNRLLYFLLAARNAKISVTVNDKNTEFLLDLPNILIIPSENIPHNLGRNLHFVRYSSVIHTSSLSF